ncbi:MAG TPA: serine/threonine-protein kinase, partial [Candidatus Aminicenantes bacterium]|nr:serine/threonine-protein kinase [Candidatus Aminicenantes bacterium]
MLLKCPSCQADNQPDSRFCSRCATPLPQEAPSDSDGLTRTMIASIDRLERGILFAGRYEIIEEIGRGGMGRVYRAYDRQLKEDVALKLLKPEISFNEKAVERFRNELKFARRIAHPRVCRMYDLGESGLAHYLTMEYVEGEDLKAFIRRSDHLTTAKALDIGRQIAEGLEEAYLLGVVHRDL